MCEGGEKELRDGYLVSLPEPVAPGINTPVEGEAGEVEEVEEGVYGNAARALRSCCCGGGGGDASSS